MSAYSAPVASDEFAGDLAAAARSTLLAALETVADLSGGIDVRPVVREGDRGEVLVAESEGVQQLVLGSRGHGNIGELALGSVSHHCCRHAHCLVTVISHAAAVA